MLDKEPSHIQHDGEELADLHDEKEIINNPQHKEEPCKHMKVKSTLKRRWSSTFIAIISTLTFIGTVSTLIFEWKWNLSRRLIIGVVSKLKWVCLFYANIWILKFNKPCKLSPKLLLESTQNRCCFTVEFNIESTLTMSSIQRWYHVDQCRDVISGYIIVESSLSVCWEGLARIKADSCNRFSTCIYPFHLFILTNIFQRSLNLLCKIV